VTVEENKGIIHHFVERINQGDLDIIDQLVDRNFYTYIPEDGEQTAPQVLRELLSEIISAFPDLQIDVQDFMGDIHELKFNMTLSGTHSGDLWGAPGSGKKAVWTSDVTCRFPDGKFAFEWKDLPMPSLMSTLRQIDLVPPPEDMDKPTKYPISLPEFLIKVIFTGQAGDKDCSHLGLIQFTDPDTDVCQACVDMGDEWPALRMCLICGHVGCCDTSKNKHAKAHVETNGHSLVRSIRMQESWVWCYEDSAFFSGKILEQYR